MPVEALVQTFEFRLVESAGEAIAPSVEGERAGDGDGNQDGDICGVDGTMSGSSVDSIRVNKALLAVESQYMCQSRRK